MPNTSAKAIDAVTTPYQPAIAMWSSLNDDGLIELSALRPFVPFHPQHVRKLVKKGLFPNPVKVPGCRRTVFLRRDVWRYLEELSK
ncbi:MAG TPA: hypothetical protein PKE16_07785 [Hyphomicrobium sp.]|nr:hypothetical protein [Hyphomicrobium sp.]